MYLLLESPNLDLARTRLYGCSGTVIAKTQIF
jgi:hypothetical protein